MTDTDTITSDELISDAMISAFARGAQMGDPMEPGVTPLLDRTRANSAKRIRDGLTAALSARLSADKARMAEGLKAHLREHWLASIVCDHEAKTDTAICSCSQWRDEPHPSVGAAVDAWIEHVFAALQNASTTP